ncbi:hypothetical protein C5748_26355 [Phyllobacterium phragmitis]|uniref:HTH araC/xylS-type domain-containing protein n=1 Tax=Phyllobacterium phragmitis TaxID=2670329 RepID=A0A2S9IJ34_9HYPH|nr:helix-turn-helix domain-containing protein [Phyllobacterium phragmitis]PRD40553.1 hypothetical protein C5748_26355 [Phyllobacterium phragmitis]
MTEHSEFTGDQRPIPSFQFSTENLDVEDQFEAWRDFIAPIAEVKKLSPLDGGYLAHMQAYNLGVLQMALINNALSYINYTDTDRRKYGIEDWSLTILTKGAMQFTSGDTTLNMTPGNMFVHSYTTPYSGSVQDMEILQIMLNRDEFCDVADDLDRMVDRHLTGPMSQILRDFLLSLASHADRLSIADIPAVTEAFTHLLKAVVRPNADTLEAARLPIAATKLAAAKRIINENLKSPDLTPDMLCARLGISRRQLVYIFERYGGVMKFISQRRLTACYKELATSNDKKRISTVAHAYGFNNLSSFYRQFQARYGFSPGEARAAWLSGHTLNESKGGTFTDWLMRADKT